MGREVRLVARVLRVVDDIEAEGLERELDVVRARVSRAAEQDCVLGVCYACCRYQVERASFMHQWRLPLASMSLLQYSARNSQQSFLRRVMSFLRSRSCNFLHRRRRRRRRSSLVSGLRAGRGFAIWLTRLQGSDFASENRGLVAVTVLARQVAPLAPGGLPFRPRTH